MPPPSAVTIAGQRAQKLNAISRDWHKSRCTYNPQYHLNTSAIVSIILILHPATPFRISYYNLIAVTLLAEGSHYFLMNNCSWNGPKKLYSSFVLINRTGLRKITPSLLHGKTSSGYEAVVSQPLTAECKGTASPDRSSLWSLRVSAAEDLLKSERCGVAAPPPSRGHNLLLLPVSYGTSKHTCFPGVNVNKKPSSFQIRLSPQLNLRSSKHDSHLPNPGQRCQPRLVCLVLGTTQRAQKSDR